MGMATQTSLEEYLQTTYEPDCDYVEGELEERNVGEHDHALLQAELTIFLGGFRKRLGIRVLTEMRVQVGPARFRVPDLCVVFRSAPKERILTTPPFLCIEILSPQDRTQRMNLRIADYLAMGVRYVWVISPELRTGWVCTTESTVEARDGILRTADPEIAVPLAELFAEL